MSKSLSPLRTTTPDLHQFDKLVVAGCSFSACTSDLDIALDDPQGWPHFLLAKNPKIKQFANLALPGGSNLATSQNMILFLQTQFYPPQSTLVIFNLTGLDRFDLPGKIGHPNANPNFSWNRQLDYDLISSGEFSKHPIKIINEIQRNAGFDSIVLLNALAILNLITFLEAKNYTYKFMIMDDGVCKDCPSWLKDFVNTKSLSLIKFDGMNMYEFCKHNSWLAEDGFHPSRLGYERIAQFVHNSLSHIMTQKLHRFYVSLRTTDQWYAVMRECRAWFGTDWRTQPKIRRRLERSGDNPVEAWFDVPNPEWSTWIATKLALQVRGANRT